MKKIMYGIGALIVLIVVGTAIFGRSDVPADQQTAAPVVAPVIQIMSPTVVAIDDQGKVVRDLVDGDTLIPPVRIRLGSSADATIIYPDGSSARLSPGTELTVQQGSYDTTSGTVVSKIILYTGHVWSKVIALATPQSLWQVQTPHAVATVRGTIFDSLVEQGQTIFTGIEHKVDIVPIDPDTGKEMKDKSGNLDENTQVVLETNKNRRIKENKDKMSLDDVDTKKEDRIKWMNKNIRRDKVLETIRVEQKDKTDIRDALMQAKDRMQKADSEKDTTVFPKRSITPTTPVTPRDTTVSTQTTTQTNTGDTTNTTRTTTITTEQPKQTGTNLVAMDRITIKMDIPSKLVEGTTVAYRVIGITTAGTEKDLTDAVKVKVLGGIGQVVSPGKFLANLDDDKKELGKVFGALSGEWIDPATGKTISFGTPVFPVELYFEPVTDTRG